MRRQQHWDHFLRLNRKWLSRTMLLTPPIALRRCHSSHQLRWRFCHLWKMTYSHLCQPLQHLPQLWQQTRVSDFPSVMTIAAGHARLLLPPPLIPTVLTQSTCVLCPAQPGVCVWAKQLTCLLFTLVIAGEYSGTFLPSVYR